MSNTKSLFVKIITRLAVIVGLALGIVFIPNLAIFDEQLLPEISERLRTPPNADIEDNAIFALYGLAAATDKAPDVVGKNVLQTLRAKHAQGQFAHLTDTEKNALYGSENWDAEWLTTYPAADCNPRESNQCFKQLIADVKATPVTHPRLIAQLARYNQIIQLPHLIEDFRLMDYTSPVPNYYLIMQLGKLSQAKAYLEQGLDGLILNSEADMHFWRMALTGNQTLLGRVVAFASLRRNLTALSYALSQEQELSPTKVERLQNLLKPLTRKEVDMETALTTELRFSAENWQSAPKEIPAGESTILWMLTQPVALTNWHYRQTLKPAFALNRLSAMAFYEQAQNPTPALPFSRFNPYNLGGKINLAKNWQYASYIGRAHDLAGIFGMVALQLELKTIAEKEWPAAIRSSTYKNPYTEKPFDFDATTKSLSFSCFSVQDICQIQL